MSDRPEDEKQRLPDEAAADEARTPPPGEATAETDSPDPAPGHTEPVQQNPSGNPAPVAPDADKARRRAGAALAVAVLALLAVVAVAAVGWWQLDTLLRGQTRFATTDRLEDRTTALQQAVNELQDRLASVQTQLDNGSEAVVAELQQRVDAAAEARNELSARLDQIAALAQAGHEDWLRSEAAYLVTVAEHRLEYYRDVDSALDALRSADALLSQFGGEAVAARRAIARAIDALIEVSVPQIDPIADRLTQLSEAVETLSVQVERREVARPGDDGEPVQAEGETWQARLGNAWEQFRSGLGELVVVSSDSPVVPLRSPEERFFIKQNLRLQFDTARLAALQGNQELYDRSLAQVAEWIDSWLAADNSQVQRMREAVKELRGRDVHVELPDIGPMLEPARAFN
jgi:uroporphyrin-3 C-methyltransferase